MNQKNPFLFEFLLFIFVVVTSQSVVKNIVLYPNRHTRAGFEAPVDNRDTVI